MRTSGETRENLPAGDRSIHNRGAHVTAMLATKLAADKDHPAVKASPDDVKALVEWNVAMQSTLRCEKSLQTDLPASCL